MTTPAPVTPGTPFAIGSIMTLGGSIIALLHVALSRSPDASVVILFSIVSAVGVLVAASAVAQYMNSMVTAAHRTANAAEVEPAR